jgi:uncharacterized protein YlzI (FlbEa/FlbD family)
MTIKFTKVNGGPFYINPVYIVAIEPTPFGTRVVFSAGPEVILKDTEDEVISKLASSAVNVKTLTYANDYDRL